MERDPTFAIIVDPCCPTFDFVYVFCITIMVDTLLTLLFCIQKEGLFPLCIALLFDGFGLISRHSMFFFIVVIFERSLQ
jgi:hypothetical protein